MFRPMRRQHKDIGTEKAKELLTNERRGVLSVIGDDGYPYAVPINYYYDEAAGKIYFHGSKVGHKTDALKNCDKVCFTVYGNETIGDPVWAPYLQSVVVFGRCHAMTDPEAALTRLTQFAMKYYPGLEEVNDEIAVSGKAVQMYEIEIEHMTGKVCQER